MSDYRCARGGGKPHGNNRAPKGMRRANAIERANGLEWVERKMKRARSAPPCLTPSDNDEEDHVHVHDEDAAE